MPYDPASTSSPIEVQDRDDRDRAESYIRERGPLHLLEAVYCDPCKAKVITFLQLSPNLIFIARSPALSSLQFTGMRCKSILTLRYGGTRIFLGRTVISCAQMILLIQGDILNGHLQFGHSFHTLIRTEMEKSPFKSSMISSLFRSCGKSLTVWMQMETELWRRMRLNLEVSWESLSSVASQRSSLTWWTSTKTDSYPLTTLTQISGGGGGATFVWYYQDRITKTGFKMPADHWWQPTSKPWWTSKFWF